MIKSVLLGLLDRLPSGDPLLDEDEDHLDDRAEVRTLEYSDFGGHQPKQSTEEEA